VNFGLGQKLQSRTVHIWLAWWVWVAVKYQIPRHSFLSISRHIVWSISWVVSTVVSTSCFYRNNFRFSSLLDVSPGEHYFLFVYRDILMCWLHLGLALFWYLPVPAVGYRHFPYWPWNKNLHNIIFSFLYKSQEKSRTYVSPMMLVFIFKMKSKAEAILR